MSRQQKALTLTSKRGLFEITTKPIPKPQSGEVLVRIQAAGLNPMDWGVQATGLIVEDYPAILGIDAAGDIIELGEGVENLVKGDRVLFQSFPPNDYAGHQQYAVVPADGVAKLPDRISFAQAASVPATFLTAAVGLIAEKPEGAALNPTLDPNVKFSGQAALVIGGSTSVGQFAIQILKYLDFSPIVTYASVKHSEYLKSLGATHVIDRSTVPLHDLPSAFRQISSLPLNIVYNVIRGEEAQAAGYTCLSDGGQMPEASNYPPPSDPASGKRCWFVWGSSHPLPPEGRLIRKTSVPVVSPLGRLLFKKLETFLEDGTIVPNRIQVIPNGLAGIVDGLEEMRNNRVSGVKLVVQPQDTP